MPFLVNWSAQVCARAWGFGERKRLSMCARKEQSHSGVCHVTMAGGEGSCAGCLGTKVFIEETQSRYSPSNPHGGITCRDGASDD